MKFEKLTKPQKLFLADKLMDSFNYVLIAMVLNELAANMRKNVIFFGLIIFISGIIITSKLRR